MENYTTQELVSGLMVIVAVIVLFTISAFVIAPKSIDTSFANDDAKNLIHKDWVEANSAKDTEYQY